LHIYFGLRHLALRYWFSIIYLHFLFSNSPMELLSHACLWRDAATPNANAFAFPNLPLGTSTKARRSCYCNAATMVSKRLLEQPTLVMTSYSLGNQSQLHNFGRLEGV